MTDARLLRNLLRLAVLSQISDGRILSTFPTDRGPSDCHYQIEDYEMQFVEALMMYFNSTNDVAFLREAYPALRAQMAWFTSRVIANNSATRNTSGLLLAREYVSFDNPLAYVTAQGTTLNAFYYRALIDAAAVATALNETSDAVAWASSASSLRDAINVALYNSSEGTYSAGILPSGEKLAPSVHAALITLQRGVVPPSRRASVQAWFEANYRNAGSFHCCTNNDMRAMLAARAGVDFPVVYYWVFSVLYAQDSAAADTEALSEIRRRWGPMVARAPDIDTLWESFDDSESAHNSSYLRGFCRRTSLVCASRDRCARRPSSSSQDLGTWGPPLAPSSPS